MNKENLQPINIKADLKKFLYFMKQRFKDKSDLFFSDNKTLLYYLEDSIKFKSDYEKYLKIQEMMEDNVV